MMLERPTASVRTKAPASKGQVRLRAVQAAFGAALLDVVPGGPEVARLVGVDPVAHARRQMLMHMGQDADRDSTGHRSGAKASPQSARQATRVLVRVARSALRGSRYAAIVAKRATLIVTVVSSVTTGIIAYRELTTVGFAVVGDA